MSRGHVLHWVLSDCVQRARAKEFEIACAPTMREITCVDCRRAVIELRRRWLGLRGPSASTRNAFLEKQAEALRRENALLVAEVETLRRRVAETELLGRRLAWAESKAALAVRRADALTHRHNALVAHARVMDPTFLNDLDARTAGLRAVAALVAWFGRRT